MIWYIYGESDSFTYAKLHVVLSGTYLPVAMLSIIPVSVDLKHIHTK